MRWPRPRTAMQATSLSDQVRKCGARMRMSTPRRCASRRALRAQGLGRGDLVALIIGDSEQFLTTLFGASIAGVIPASLYPPATTSDLPRYLTATAGILNSCGARAVITSTGLHPHIDALQVDLSHAGARPAPARRSTPRHRDLATPCRARRHRLRAVHIGVDLGAERRGGHPSQSVGEHRRVQRTRGRGIVAGGLRRQLAADVPRYGPGRHGHRRRLRLPVGRALDAAGLRETARRLVARDFTASRHGQLRAQLCLRPGRSARQGRRTRGSGPVVLARRGMRRGADSRPDARRVCGKVPARGVPRPPAFFRAMASPSTCSPPRCRRAGGNFASNTSPPTTVTVRRVATHASAGHGERLTVVSCGLPLPGHRIRIADEDGRRPARTRYRRDQPGWPLGHAGLLQRRGAHRQEHSRRVAAHRRPRVLVESASCSCAAG